MESKRMKKIWEMLCLIIDYISEISFWEAILAGIVFSLSVGISACLIELGRRMIVLGI